MGGGEGGAAGGDGGGMGGGMGGATGGSADPIGGGEGTAMGGGMGGGPAARPTRVVTHWPCSNWTRAQLTTSPSPVGRSTSRISRQVPAGNVPSRQTISGSR
jgi:hypothetical protein